MTAAETTLTLEGFGRLPATELRLRDDGRVVFRYVVEDERDYPGFDGRWREMSESEWREHLRMGGRIAEWLKAVGKGGEGS